MSDFQTRTGPFVMAMVLACKGEVRAQQDVSALIGQMLRDPASALLGQHLMQIIVGERDRIQLTADLAGEPLWLVNTILDSLAEI